MDGLAVSSVKSLRVNLYSFGSINEAEARREEIERTSGERAKHMTVIIWLLSISHCHIYLHI